MRELSKDRAKILHSFAKWAAPSWWPTTTAVLSNTMRLDSKKIPSSSIWGQILQISTIDWRPSIKADAFCTSLLSTLRHKSKQSKSRARMWLTLHWWRKCYLKLICSMLDGNWRTTQMLNKLLLRLVKHKLRSLKCAGQQTQIAWMMSVKSRVKLRTDMVLTSRKERATQMKQSLHITTACLANKTTSKLSFP